MIRFKNTEKSGDFEMWRVSDNTVYFKHVVDGNVRQEQLCSREEAREFRRKLDSKGWVVHVDDETLEAAHRASIYNKSEVGRDTVCACFFCVSPFQTSEITEWVDKGGFHGKIPPDQTAVCPGCGIDSILSLSALGFMLSSDLLIAMHMKYAKSSCPPEGDYDTVPPTGEKHVREEGAH